MANNNYDRMLRGEAQQPTNIPNKAKANRQTKKRRAALFVRIALCVISVLVGLMTLGAVGAAVQGFFLGVFGWYGVLYSLLTLVLCTLSLAGVLGKRRLTRSQGWLVAGGAVLAFIIMLFAHLWSSHAAYDVVSVAKGNVTYGDYLGQVYRHGISTAGGALFSLVAYPFLNAVGLRLSGILLAVLFFGVLFSMIYPFWLTTKESRVIEDDVPAEEGAPRLFVETVDGKPSRANRARSRRRAQNFDFSYPNGNDIEEDHPEELDLIDEEDEASHEAPQNAEDRRASAMEILLGIKDTTTQVDTAEEGGYDPTRDAQHPLQFGTRHNAHSDWARPAEPEVDRDSLSPEARRQQSIDILFGDAPAPRRTYPTPPPAAERPRGLAEGSTIETVVPSQRDAHRPERPNADAAGTTGQTVYKISDNGDYVNRPNPPRTPSPAPSSTAASEPPVVPPVVEPQAQPSRIERTENAEPRVSRPPEAGHAPAETQYPFASQQYEGAVDDDTTPSSEASRADFGASSSTPAAPREAVEADLYYGEAYEPARSTPPAADTPRMRLAASRPIMPEEASVNRPVEYPTYEEDSLDAALHSVQDDYEEPDEEEQTVDEEPIVVDKVGYVEREGEETPAAFNGFVRREVKPASPAETPPEAPQPVRTPRPRDEARPRANNGPDEATRQAARAFAPEPPKKVRPYTAPPLYLLKDYPPPEDTEDYEEMSKNLEEAFASYGIEVHVIGHTRGPTYTQYAVRLADGVPFKRVSNLGQDIVRKMCLSEEINIVPKVPNMDAIGVEIINKTRQRVGLKPLLTSSKFRQDKKLYFVLGVDVMGRPYYCDILSGPHMLIAGSSGSGKSVCLNTLICSLLFNYKPDYVKFILIDPKGGVEMDVYNDLPHNMLGKAAVTPANTIKALDWAIEEMERRYQLMRDVNVRNWGDYNDKLLAGNMPRLPYILIVIDELAELMNSSKKNAADIEVRIARLTAKARASGIHVIVATQRPSVDVITGTIKNNIPTRVAFKTATQIDSKTILEKGCAEKLYGKGDMYFMSSEFNELKRLQGPFLTDDEVCEICDNIRANNDCAVDELAAARIFKEDVEEEEKQDNAYADEDKDEGEVNENNLFERAVRAAAEAGMISTSRLQRMYHLGFNRAAVLMDEMEERGFVEKAVMGSSRPRRVLITPEECDEIFGYRDDDDDD